MGRSTGLAFPHDEEGLGDYSSRTADLKPNEYSVNSSIGAISGFLDGLISTDRSIADGNVSPDIDHLLSFLCFERTVISQVPQNIKAFFVVGSCGSPIF